VNSRTIEANRAGWSSTGRIHRAVAASPRRATRPTEPTTVPLGVAGFAGDFSGVRRFAERDHKNIVQWNLHPEPGGHYAAHQEPAALTDDIRGFYAGLV
jgi:hypothetical protein